MKKIITLKLDHEMDAALTRLAQQRGTTRSALVREAVAQYTAGQATGSFAELGADLAGVVHGPADLSVDARHLAGYGR